jgi:hypothetical protein
MEFVRRITPRTQGSFEVRFERRPELRILSLGDSNAFGWGVEIERSYPKILERLHFE